MSEEKRFTHDNKVVNYINLFKHDCDIKLKLIYRGLSPFLKLTELKKKQTQHECFLLKETAACQKWSFRGSNVRPLDYNHGPQLRRCTCTMK